MSRYIDVEPFEKELLEAIKKFNQDDDEAGIIMTRFFLKSLSEIPTADVKPVVRGEWVNNHDGFGLVCNLCNYQSPYDDWDYQYKSNFCPNCSADMRGKRNE